MTNNDTTTESKTMTIETICEQEGRKEFSKACKKFGIENVKVELVNPKSVSPIYRITIRK